MSTNQFPADDKDVQKAMAATHGDADVEVFINDTLDHKIVTNNTYGYLSWVAFDGTSNEWVRVDYASDLSDGTHALNAYIYYTDPSGNKYSAIGSITVTVSGNRTRQDGTLDATFNGIAGSIRIVGTYSLDL